MIELLVVMMIIGLLAGLTMFSFQNARKQGRDAKRKSDLETIRSALELYKADCNVYPASLPAVNGQLTGSACTPSNTNVYLQSMPGDPVTTQLYGYRRLPGNVTYTLCSTLEDPPTPANNVSNCNSCGSPTACRYKVINP